MTIWEYKVDYGISVGGILKIGDFQEHLSGRGEEGWELVSVFPKNAIVKTEEEEMWLIFKRPILPKKVTG